MYRATVILAVLSSFGPGPVFAQILKLTDPQEIEVGRRAAAEIEFEQKLLTDEKVAGYVQKIGLRLARESGRSGLRFFFKVLDSDDINAFALPGGFVYVTSGLLNAAGSESELAGALAHEVGHIAARQHAGKIRRSQLALLGVSFLGPAVGGGIRATAALRGGRPGVRGLFLRFTREDEREADRIAAKMLYDAGYHPEAMLNLLRRIASLEEGDSKLAKRYFSSHAKIEDRADSISDMIATFPATDGLKRDSAEFPRIKAHWRSIRPVAALPSSEAAAAVLEASEQEPESAAAKDREVAALYAPLLYQAIGNQPRYDYITNFDFDGDWRGDNNWANAARPEYSLKAWIYYSVRYTKTHYFLHYAAFHPRDYKGDSRGGRVFNKLIRTATKPAAAIDPTGRASEAVLAHENDMEGCLIVVERHGDDPKDGKVVFVQTLAHNNFLKYRAEAGNADGSGAFHRQGRRVKLYVEAKGHGIEAFDPAGPQAKAKVRLFTFTGQAEEPSGNQDEPVGYDLAPIATTLWPEAQRGVNPTYAETEEFGSFLLALEKEDGAVHEDTWKVGRIGSSFRGAVGGVNLARPPWSWFDAKDKAQPRGEWFLDPARAIRRDFGLGAGFSVAYTQLWPPE
jgi:Zn-dependent protease with chaperone function